MLSETQANPEYKGSRISVNISNMPSRNSEDSFKTPPHTPDQALCLLMTDTLVIAGPTRPGFG